MTTPTGPRPAPEPYGRCARCGEPCRVAEARDPAAEMIRKADRPSGHCLNCAVAEWFVLSGARDTTDPKELLEPAFQACFAAVMQLGRSDADPKDVDWAKVVEHWGLPFGDGAAPKGRRARRSRGGA